MTQRVDGPLALTSGLLLVIAVVFFAVALSMADPSDGANIGAGIAIMSAMAAGTGATLSVLIPRITSPAARLFSTVVGWLAVGFAAKGLLLVAAGIIEDLSRGG